MTNIDTKDVDAKNANMEVIKAEEKAREADEAAAEAHEEKASENK